MNIYRQGDVLIVEVDGLTGSSRKPEKRVKSVTLALGEATGHSHVLTAEDVDVFSTWQVNDVTRQTGIEMRPVHAFRIADPGRVTHEEHAEIELPAGEYLVFIQREYTPAGQVRVYD